LQNLKKCNKNQKIKPHYNRNREKQNINKNKTQMKINKKYKTMKKMRKNSKNSKNNKTKNYQRGGLTIDPISTSTLNNMISKNDMKGMNVTNDMNITKGMNAMKDMNATDSMSIINKINDDANKLNQLLNDGQQTANSIDPQQNQDPSDGVGGIITVSGDDKDGLGKDIKKGLDPDGTADETSDETTEQTGQSSEKSEQLQKYLQYIQNNPNFIQSALSNVIVKPTAYLINDLASLLNIEMNNPEKLKLQLDEMADSIQDPDERNKILNYNAQVLAVYLSASKPSIDIITGIFSQEVSEILGDIIYNMSTTIQNMIPGISLLNDIPQMLTSIVQAMTTLAQLTNTGASSTQQNIQQLNKSIMNDVNTKNKLIIEQKKQAEILEKQNKLVTFILEKPEIINFYVKYLNKYKNENIDLNDIISNSTNMTGGRKEKIVNLDKQRENILNAIKESLHNYEMMN